jgi:hypothetical protein
MVRPLCQASGAELLHWRGHMQIHFVGIDIGKLVFHLVALDEHGNVVMKKRLSRSQLLKQTANLAAKVIGRGLFRGTLPGACLDGAGAHGSSDAGRIREGLCEVEQE